MRILIVSQTPRTTAHTSRHFLHRKISCFYRQYCRYRLLPDDARVYSWESVPVYHEQYNAELPAEAGIAREIERYTTELDRDWVINQPQDIREAMELVEKTVTELMSGALKYCDTCEPGSARHHQYQVIKQIFFHHKIFWVFTKRLRQVRAGMIHHRLASLYHHSYRATLAQEARSRKLRQLAELHYVKAAALFSALAMFAQAIRTVLERAGLLEVALASAKSEAGKSKVLLQILDIILENEEVLGKMIARDEVEELDDKDEIIEEQKMTETILQRLQFTLLSLVKSGSGASSKNKKKGDKRVSDGGGIVKELYGLTLKCSASSENFVKELQQLLTSVKKERANM